MAGDRKPIRPRTDPPDLYEAVERLAGLGHTQAEIAAFLDVTPKTLQRWEKGCPDYNVAIVKGRARAHVSVSRHLFDAARGQALRSETRSPVLDPAGNRRLDAEGKPLERVTRTYHKPNLGAMVFYLCNREPRTWKNTQRHEVETSGTGLRGLVLVVGDERVPITADAEIVDAEPGDNGHKPGSLKRLSGPKKKSGDNGGKR